MMDDDGTLQKIRQLVFAKVEHSVANTQDAFRHEVSDLLPLYLMFKTIDRLDEIDESLGAIYRTLNEH
jgi:hypothetical protein